MSNIFILSYCNAKEFHSKQAALAPFYFIDNGNQEYESTLGCTYFTTEKNIGCAGGWNLICDIAFDYLNLDKIVITQDDINIDKDLINAAYEETNGLQITGVIQPFFEFSCFVITKEVWNLVGRFDENFIYVYSEDADYKQRCYLNGVSVNSMYVSNTDANQSISVKKDPSIDRLKYNREYLATKWGESIHPSFSARQDNQAPFYNKSPFSTLEDSLPIEYIPLTNRIKNIFGDIDTFPSIIEYERFKKIKWD